MSSHPSDNGADTSRDLAAFGQVAGELLHDLANEVQVLQGWALLARGEADAGRVPRAETLRVATLAADLGRMLRDVVDTLAHRALSPEVTFDPHVLTEAVVGDRVRDLAPLSVRLESGLPKGVRVAGRSSFWIRLVANLVLNASRFAKNQVLVRLWRMRDPEGGWTVVLRVEDDGPGISRADQEAIFQPLWRGERGGAGLGLSSVRWVAGQLGGHIAYDERCSLGGAAFEFRVPAVAGFPLPTDNPAGEPLLQGSRLLVIDDDAAVRRALSRLLVRAGAEARELDPTGEPEEQLLQGILGAIPDFILLDLWLGERGGVALWNRLAMEMPQLAARVVFVSGAFPGDPLWEAAARTGQPVLGKPFDLERLLGVLVQLRAEG